ncbi:YecA family protein [Vibrio hyugaensis]|uniref:YecA family protein n=1 Tax=Vibrio hyugaensis TaxID=1534743 RepID=UPI002157E351|nr:SEC-C metal-binding domain-containing protein [Vibrio hyugaensis]
MTTSIIQPCAARLFNTYSQHAQSSSLESLQYLVEEAYKLHERMRKNTAYKTGLLDLDEFLLLKALRNYSVHQGEFLGEAYYIDTEFAKSMQLELLRVCLVKRATVNLAINHEPTLEHGEENKINRIRGQLVDFGDFFNLEPVIFNFMVKVYEKLKTMNLAIPGQGYADIDQAYLREKHFNYPHYLSLHPANCGAEEIKQHLVPLNKSTALDRSGLPAPEQDPFHQFSTLELNYQALSPIDYEGDDYEAIHQSLTHQIQEKPDSLLIAKALPTHQGMAFIASENSIDVTCFNITAQKELFENHNIELDPFFYQPSINELLALFIHNNKIFPVILHKSDFITTPKSMAMPSKTEWDELVASIKIPASSHKVGRNEPCPCGSGKKYKKCCA